MTNITDDFGDGKGNESDASGSQGNVDQRNEDLALIESVRFRQDFDVKATSKRAIVSVPVRKPDKKWFVQVHPDINWQVELALMEDGREQYIVSPAVYDEVAELTKPSLVYTAITSTGNVFFWPVSLPKEDDSSNSWTESAQRAVARAKDRWIRVSPNWTFKSYDVFEAQGRIPSPVWPEMGFSGLFKIAFAGRIIDNRDHAVMKRLRGE
jgi:hypothetical protein